MATGCFEGRVAFVTGGGTGIGLACARAIHAEGGHVVLAGRREEVLQAAAKELGSRAETVVCDVRDDASVEAAVEASVAIAKAVDGRLCLAVNAAGTGSIGSVLNSTAEQFGEVLDTNLVGVFRCLRAEARAMKARGGGSIVNISSIAAVLSHRWMDAYCASKAGLDMLTRCSADDLGEHGIRVNAVQPSLVDTDLVAPMMANDDVRTEYLRRIPLGRLGVPEDVATVVRFLLSDEAGWVTGQCFGVDGGHTLRQGPELVPQFRALLPEER